MPTSMAIQCQSSPEDTSGLSLLYFECIYSWLWLLCHLQIWFFEGRDDEPSAYMYIYKIIYTYVYNYSCNFSFAVLFGNVEREGSRVGSRMIWKSSHSQLNEYMYRCKNVKPNFLGTLKGIPSLHAMLTCRHVPVYSPKETVWGYPKDLWIHSVYWYCLFSYCGWCSVLKKILCFLCYLHIGCINNSFPLALFALFHRLGIQHSDVIKPRIRYVILLCESIF